MDQKLILIIALGVVAILAGAYFVFFRGTAILPGIGGEQELRQSETSPESDASPTVHKISVSGTEFKFEPKEIKVKAGERVRITLENEGSYPHDLIIEGMDVATERISSGKTSSVEFTAPSAGTYTTYCSVPGHKEAGMVGSLVVE